MSFGIWDHAIWRVVVDCDSEERVFIDGSHLSGLFLPVAFVPLDDTQAINP